MSVFLDGKRWRYRRAVTKPNGAKVRVSGTPAVNTKAAAEAAERNAISNALSGRVRIGRPPESGESRTEQITLRVSHSEHARLSRYAREQGHGSISDMLRAELQHLLGGE